MGMIKSILLIGACGSGKTWVMRQLIEKYKLLTLGKVGTIYFHRNSKVAVLGKYDGTTFEGSDKLSMAVMKDLPKFLEFVKKHDLIIVAEGDRFTNKTFIELACPKIFKITDDGAKGRLKRGSSQTERQIKSIATRVSNLGKTADEAADSSEALRKIAKEIKLLT
jgi:hypothetical protein